MATTKSLVFDVLAKTQDSDDKLALLQARLSEMKDRYGDLNLNINADDLKARAAVDEMAVKMDALSRKVANPKISIQGMERAALDLDRISLKMDDIEAQAEGDSLLSKIFGGGSGGSGGGIGSSLGSVPYLPLAIGGLAVGAASVAPALIPTALGAGIGGLGAIVLDKLDPAFAKAVANLGTDLKSTLSGALTTGGSSSFASGLTSMLPGIDKFIKSEGPELAKMFQASIPFIRMFVSTLEQAAKVLLPAFTQSMKEITPYLPQMEKGLMAIVQGIADFVKDLGPGMKDSVIVFVAMAEAVKGALIAIAVIASATAIVLVKLSEGVQRAVDDIHDAFDQARRWTATAFDDIRHTIVSVLDSIRDDVIKPFVGGVETAFRLLVSNVKAVFDTASKSWEHVFNAPFEHMLRDVTDFEAKALSVIVGFVGKVETWFADLATNVTGRVLKFETDIANAFSSMVDRAVNAVTGLAGKVWNAAFQPVLNLINSFGSRATGAMNSAGSSLVSGLIHGIESQFGSLINLMNRMASDVINNPITRFFGISSPSTLFMQHGENLVEGLVLGIQRGEPGATSAVSNLTGRISRSVATSALGTGGGSSGGWEMTVTFQPTGNELIDALGKNMRAFVKAKGGAASNSAQKALGQRI